MRVLVTGSSGLIGSALVARLAEAGRTVLRLVRRRPAGEGEAFWDPASGEVRAEALEGVDAAVHLAGEAIADARWTSDRKRRIRDSRVEGTRLLAEALAGRRRRPGVLLCASAVGFYGERGDEPLDETSPPGEGFLPETCLAWEAAAEPARAAGIRVAHLRFGIVLSTRGGALARMLPPFRLGLGGRLGHGRQYLSWVSLADAVGACLHLMERDEVSGPVNVTSPRPVRNADFARTLGRVLRRPVFLAVPAPLLRLALGEVAESLLGGARVLPARLERGGYPFEDAELEPALRRMLA